MCSPGKAIPGMTYTVFGGTLNPTHSLRVKRLLSGKLQDV